MRIVELILCRITATPIPTLYDPPTESNVAIVRTWLAHVARVLHKASDFTPRILQDESDLSSVYFITVWHDLAKHDEFEKSPAHDELVSQASAIGSLDWMGLFQVRHPHDLPLKANVIAFSRLHVPTEEAGEFEKAHQKARHVLSKYSNHSVCEGWKVKEYEMNDAGDFNLKPVAETEEGAQGRREYIVISGYDTLEKRLDFPMELDKWQEYSVIKQYIRWFERRNMRVIALQ